MKRSKATLRIVFVALVGLIAVLPPGIRQVAAQEPTSCAALTLAAPHSDACNATITAYPEPNLERPVTFDPKKDGVSQPRSVLLPKEPLLFPIGWVLKDWYFSDAPGVEPPAYTVDRIIHKARVLYLYATINVQGMDWHLIGLDRWISGEHIAELRIPQRPEGVSGQWVAIDLTEQTLVALVDDTPIFATLISAAWEGYGVTREGLFQIYGRAIGTTFRGPPWADPPKYVYPHTPYVQFFDGNIAFHGAYWHDWFGFNRSHGCVNVPVGDARWLWEWVNQTADKWGPDKGAFRLPNPKAAPYVYVYHSPRTGETRL